MKNKIELFIKNSSDFYEDRNVDNIDDKHKLIIDLAYTQFLKDDINKNSIKNWTGQSDLNVPPQISLLQFRYNGIFKTLFKYFSRLLFRFNDDKFIKSTILDDIEIIKKASDGEEFLNENPVHKTPGSTLFFEYKKTTVNVRWLRYLYIAQKIKSLKLIKGNEIWVDVGSYYGGLAGIIKKYFPGIKIILVDFHHQLCRSYIYMSELYPDANHIFPNSIGKYKNFKDLPDGCIMYVPVSKYKNIIENQVDLFTNFFSFGEMRYETFKSYTESALYKKAKNIYLVNRFVSSPYFESTYDTDLNILDYDINNSKTSYFDIFPIHHYMLVKRKVLGRKQFRNFSSPYFEYIKFNEN